MTELCACSSPWVLQGGIDRRLSKKRSRGLSRHVYDSLYKDRTVKTEFSRDSRGDRSGFGLHRIIIGLPPTQRAITIETSDRVILFVGFWSIDEPS